MQAFFLLLPSKNCFLKEERGSATRQTLMNLQWWIVASDIRSMILGKNGVLYNLISTALGDTDWKTAPAFSFMFTEQHSGCALGEVWRMSIKGLFKYLSNKVCKLSLGCSYWRGVMQPQLSKEQLNARQAVWIVGRHHGLGYSVN